MWLSVLTGSDNKNDCAGEDQPKYKSVKGVSEELAILPES
jgi:hypothetical protein